MYMYIVVLFEPQSNMETFLCCLDATEPLFEAYPKHEPPHEKTNNLHMRTAKLISAYVFATRIVQFFYFLNPKFPVSSHLLCLYSPVRKPDCWFSHEVAHIIFICQKRWRFNFIDLLTITFCIEQCYVDKDWNLL